MSYKWVAGKLAIGIWSNVSNLLGVRRRMKLLSIGPLFIVSTALIVVGCNNHTDQLARGWPPPVKVTESKDSLVGGVLLYKWHGSILVFQGLDPRIARDVSARCFLIEPATNNDVSPSEVQLVGVPQGYIVAYPAIDPTTDKVFFEQGYTENGQVVIKVLIGRMAGSATLRDGVEMQRILDIKELFGEARSNVILSARNEGGKRDRLPGMGLGIVSGSDLYIPYCLEGVTQDQNGIAKARGPYSSGVFHSSDSGVTWQRDQVSDSHDGLPSIIKSRNYWHYLAVSLPTKPGHVWELWCSTKSANGHSWDSPRVITPSFARSALLWQYVAEAEDDVVHVCWLDSRHEKMRADLVYPNRENYEVAYCRRKDFDANWSKDVILSDGILYSYSPTMSVEGDNVVVAWAGVATAPDGHNEHSPNDIYYRTSRDGGKTWGKLLRLTDGAKAGMTAGCPAVALQSGIIHLFYIQGKLNLNRESPGLTKLNQPPWPIYYQRRTLQD